MTSGQKIAFSSLISIALFGAFAFLTRSGFIPEIETRFYAQAKIQQKEEQLDLVTENVDLYIQDVLTRIESGDNAYLKSVAVSTYLSQDPAESDTVERRNQTEQLFYDFPALSGIRFIDKNGRNIHFSTYDRTDVAKHVGIKKQYKNYTDVIETERELDVRNIFSENHLPDRKVYFDSDRNRFLIVIPVNWLENVYAGCFLFYFDVQTLENQLIEKNVLPFTDSITLISDKDLKGGFVLGIPKEEKNIFSEAITGFWKNKTSGVKSEKASVTQPEKLLSMKDGRFWMILNSLKKSDFWISGVYTSDIFELSKELIYLIYIALFISIFLIVFLIFSLKRDSMQVLQKRIKRLQYGIIKEYLNNQEKVEWESVANQLRIRNTEISQEIRKSLGKKNKYDSEQIDAILDKSWNEIIEVVTHYSGSSEGSEKNGSAVEVSNPAPVTASGENPVTLEQIRAVMKELLQTTTVNVAHSAVSSSAKAPVPEVIDEVEEIEDVEPVEELDDVEEIEEVESVEDIEEIESLEDVEPIEEIDEAETLDEVEELEDVESLDEVVPLDEEAPVEELEDVEPVEEQDDVEEIEEVEEIQEVEAIEDLDDVEEIETLEEPEALENDSEIEDIHEEIKEEEPAEEIDVAEEKEELPEVEEFEEIDDVEDIQEIETLEESEESEKLEDLETLEEPEDIPVSMFDPTAVYDNEVPVLNSENIKDVSIFVNDNFATTDTILLEELTIGPEVKFPLPFEKSEITIYPHLIDEAEALEKVNETEGIDDIEEIEELGEETIEEGIIPNQFSLVQFGLNVGELQELQEETSSSIQTIIEQEGVFSISNNLEFSKVQQNPDFKSLVDSVLNN